MRRVAAALCCLALAATPLTPAYAAAPRASGTVASAVHASAGAASTRLNLVTHVRTTKKVVFITIDDGVVRDREFLRLVRERHLPVTVFLTMDYAASGAHARYFQQLQEAGAVIQNHTMSHPDLRRVGDRQLRREICTASARQKRLFGRAPTLFRAPYGAIDNRVLRTARSCGMTTVGWDAVMPQRGGLGTWNRHGRLHPGDIVLLHFVPGLVGQLRKVLAEADRRHLTVAQLEDYVHPPR